jgi:hypothetical protein
MIKLVAVAPKMGWETRDSGATCDVNIASTSFSSCIDRAFVKPTIGWLDRVILPWFAGVDQRTNKAEQDLEGLTKLAQCKYVRVGMRPLLRYLTPYCNVESLIFVGTTRREG